jgi:Tol biopolymer transport system component
MISTYRFSILFVLLLALSFNVIAQQNSAFPILQGPYLGQKPPGMTPELFAPGIVSTGILTRDVAMMPDGKEIYFGAALGNYAFSTILVTKYLNGRWTEPEVMKEMDNPKYLQLEPCISPDGKRFFFLSTRPDQDSVEGDQDIWVMDRSGETWGKPYNLGAPVNSDASEYFPSVTRSGTMYFTRSEKGSRLSFLYRSKYINGQYTTPEKLPPQVNCGQSQFNAFVDPDERYIIVPATGRQDSKGSTDYYIVFRNPDDTWQEPINMGDAINTPGGLEYSPYVSPDGKYLFFMSSRLLPANQWPRVITRRFLLEMHNRPENGNPAIYWMSAAVIEQLRSKK